MVQVNFPENSIQAGFDGEDVLWMVDGVGCGERFCAQGDYISDFGYAFRAVEHDGYGLRIGAGVDELYVKRVVLRLARDGVEEFWIGARLFRFENLVAVVCTEHYLGVVAG